MECHSFYLAAVDRDEILQWIKGMPERAASLVSVSPVSNPSKLPARKVDPGNKKQWSDSLRGRAAGGDGGRGKFA